MRYNCNNNDDAYENSNRCKNKKEQTHVQYDC